MVDYCQGGILMLDRLRKRIYSDNTMVCQLPVSAIQPNPAQPRKIFYAEELRELSNSILENGVLQPITVRKSGNNYTLVAGERRLRASIMAGLREIPAIITDINEKESSLIALVENLQRCDLDFFEEAMGIHNLIRIHGFSQDEAAKKLGKSQSAISNKLRLLRLPPKIIDSILVNHLSERHARALLRLDDSDAQEQALDHIIAKGLNVSQTDEYIESLLVRSQSAKPVENKPKPTTFVFKDVRLFINTINHAVSTMRNSGVKADMEKTEDDDAVTMTIRILKNA